MASQLKLRNIRELWLDKLVKPEIFSTLGAPEKFKAIFDQAQNVENNGTRF